jgi:LPXTG-site transpeptidase (sortase) family protein
MTNRHALLRWIERAAILIAIVCLGWVGIVKVQAALYDREQRSRFEAERRAELTGDREPGTAAASGVPASGVIGILEIPRLGFSEIVAEGDDEETLQIAIGHLPDTPLPWQAGNSAMAGHRDGRFRPLRHIKVGDRIRLLTKNGTFEYTLRKTVIVNPTDVWVLDPTPVRTLTLITCYPFSYVGRAPKRFVLTAEAVDAPPIDTRAHP